MAKKGFGWYVGGGTRLERCILQAVIVFSRIDAVIHFLENGGHDGNLFIDSYEVKNGKPGRVGDNPVGLWTPRPRFEAGPGYLFLLDSIFYWIQ